MHSNYRLKYAWSGWIKTINHRRQSVNEFVNVCTLMYFGTIPESGLIQIEAGCSAESYSYVVTCSLKINRHSPNM